ncbi:MAG: flagellar hook-length control protein FliK [Lachnospiraceae bacterium]|nr:flagellar hook-length control protein FliK [Lachnospiraceae bacterium]
MGALNVSSAEAMAKIQVIGNMPGPQQTKQVQNGQEGAGSFQDMMNNIQTKQQSTNAVTELKGAGESRQPVNDSSKQTDAASKPKDVSRGEGGNEKGTADKTQGEQNKVRDDSGKTETAKSETGEKLEGAVEEIKTVIAEKLNISEDDLEQVMETLGLTNLDLLNPQTIPQIVTEVNETDIGAVLADESLSGTVQELMGEVRTTVARIAQELNMTPQEFTAAVEEAQAVPEVEVPVEDQEFTLERPQENLISDEATPVTEEAVRTPAEAADRATRAVDRPDGQPEGNEIRVEVERMDASQQQVGRDDGKGRQEHHEGGQSPMNLFQQNLTNAVQETLNSNTTSDINPVLTYEEVREVMNQIQSAVKMRITAETQSMEMQLNPANLGRVGLQIVSRAGAITAQFEATNATVKEALENQVAELRKQLEDQGIKIEKVEVTLREQGFEGNFLNDQQQNQNFENEGSSRTRTRRILFDPEAEEEGEGTEAIDEAEALTRRMMRLSGNRVDFTA